MWIFFEDFIFLWGVNFVGVFVFFFFGFVSLIVDGVLVLGVDDFWFICWVLVVMVFWSVFDRVWGLGGIGGFFVLFFMVLILFEGFICVLEVFVLVVGVDLNIFIGVVIIVILGLVFLFFIVIMVDFIGVVIIVVFILLEVVDFSLFLFRVV